MKHKSSIVELQPMTLLPPAKDKCQECAVDHDPSQPHDATSIFYGVKFKMENKNKEPSWITAMAHCDDFVKKLWKQKLIEMGIDVDGGKVFPPRKNR